MGGNAFGGCIHRLMHRVEPFETTPLRPIDPPYEPVGWFTVRTPSCSSPMPVCGRQ